MPEAPAAIPFEPEFSQAPSQGELSKQVGLKKLKNWHEMVAEYMLLHPTADRTEIAAHFEVTTKGLSYVLDSDMFQMYYRQRKSRLEEEVDRTALDRLKGKLAGVAERSLDVLDEKIQAERQSLGIDAVRETAEMALKSLGFAPNASKAPQPGVSVSVVVSADTLREARELMHQRQPLLPSPDDSE